MNKRILTILFISIGLLILINSVNAKTGFEFRKLEESVKCHTHSMSYSVGLSASSSCPNIPLIKLGSGYSYGESGSIQICEHSYEWVDDRSERERDDLPDVGHWVIIENEDKIKTSATVGTSKSYDKNVGISVGVGSLSTHNVEEDSYTYSYDLDYYYDKPSRMQWIQSGCCVYQNHVCSDEVSDDNSCFANGGVKYTIGALCSEVPECNSGCVIDRKWCPHDCYDVDTSNRDDINWIDWNENLTIQGIERPRYLFTGKLSCSEVSLCGPTEIHNMSSSDELCVNKLLGSGCGESNKAQCGARMWGSVEYPEEPDDSASFSLLYGEECVCQCPREYGIDDNGQVQTIKEYQAISTAYTWWYDAYDWPNTHPPEEEQECSDHCAPVAPGYNPFNFGMKCKDLFVVDRLYPVDEDGIDPIQPNTLMGLIYWYQGADNLATNWDCWRYSLDFGACAYGYVGNGAGCRWMSWSCFDGNFSDLKLKCSDGNTTGNWGKSLCGIDSDTSLYCLADPANGGGSSSSVMVDNTINDNTLKVSSTKKENKFKKQSKIIKQDDIEGYNRVLEGSSNELSKIVFSDILNSRTTVRLTANWVNDTNRATNTPFIIGDVYRAYRGDTIIRVNQRDNSTVDLGVYEMDESSSIEINNDADGVVVFDELKFELLECAKGPGISISVYENLGSTMKFLVDVYNNNVGECGNENYELTSSLGGTFENKILNLAPQSSGQTILTIDNLNNGDYYLNVYALDSNQLNAVNYFSFNVYYQEASFDFSTTGWYLISLPYKPIDKRVESVFDGVYIDGGLYKYNFNTGYLVYPISFSNVDELTGYWLYLSSSGDISYITLDRSGSDKIISLGNRGWYIIAGPSSNMSIRDVIVKVGAETKTFDQAVSSGWIEPNLYFIENGNYKTVGLDPWDEEILRPWYGYWVHTERDNLELIY